MHYKKKACIVADELGAVKGNFFRYTMEKGPLASQERAAEGSSDTAREKPGEQMAGSQTRSGVWLSRIASPRHRATHHASDKGMPFGTTHERYCDQMLFRRPGPDAWTDSLSLSRCGVLHEAYQKHYSSFYHTQAN